MNLVFGHDQTVLNWLAQSFGVRASADAIALGVVDPSGVLRGAYVITWRHNATAELHVYGALSNDTVRAMFRAVFQKFGVWRLEVRTPRKNKRVRKAARKFGFAFEAVERDFYGPGLDSFAFAMIAPDCRWLKEVHRGIALQDA